MSATELLADLAQRGIRLEVDGDRLRYHPRAAVTPDVLAQLRTHKGDLLAILGVAPSGPVPGWPKDVPVPDWWPEVSTGWPPGFLSAAKAATCQGCGFPVAVRWPGIEGKTPCPCWSCPRCGLQAGCGPDAPRGPVAR